MDPAQINPRLALARLAAQEAGRLTLRYFQSDELSVELKADDSPVTAADRGAELLLRQRIAEHFPHDGILGEEFPEQQGTSGFRWIVDPIDGTKSFIHGVPLYGTLVGVEHQGQPLIGAVALPALDELLFAASGQGTWHVVGTHAPRRVQASSAARLADSLVCSSDTRFPPHRRQAYAALQDAARVSRTWGDCYGYVLVATGRAEAMIDPIMNVWDAAAVAPVVIEAGGTFTDWQGRSTIYGGEGIATNGRVLDEVLAFTRGS